MGKKIKYKQLSSNKYVIEEHKINIREKDSRMQFPMELGKKITGKKLKVTIEVLEE